MKNFENKTIIITGAAMGLGLAAAKELAAQGANLALPKRALKAKMVRKHFFPIFLIIQRY